jgi:hypothetical protein
MHHFAARLAMLLPGCWVGWTAALARYALIGPRLHGTEGGERGGKIGDGRDGNGTTWRSLVSYIAI